MLGVIITTFKTLLLCTLLLLSQIIDFISMCLFVTDWHVRNVHLTGTLNLCNLTE